LPSIDPAAPGEVEGKALEKVEATTPGWQILHRREAPGKKSAHREHQGKKILHTTEAPRREREFKSAQMSLGHLKIAQKIKRTWVQIARKIFFP